MKPIYAALALALVLSLSTLAIPTTSDAPGPPPQDAAPSSDAVEAQQPGPDPEPEGLFHSQEGGFRLRFPAAPEVDRRGEWIAGGPARIEIAVLHQETGASWIAITTTLLSTDPGQRALELLEATQTSMLDSSAQALVLIQQGPWAPDGAGPEAQGRTFLARGPGLDPSTLQAWLLSKEQVVVQLFVTGPRSAFDEEDLDAFIGSFAFEERTAR